MTRVYRIFTLANLATLLFISLAHAGGISSSGGDNPSPDQASAWFLGPQPVRYCIVLDPNFGISEAVAEATIATSFQVWRDYIQAKHINDPGFADGPLGTYNNGTEPASNAKIMMNTELIATCDQTEDLKIYLGGMNDEVKQYISAFTNPTAFAQRTAYDGIRGWGKGFIWVTGPQQNVPVSDIDWKWPFRLQGILLHEIGHVLGNSHIDHTIMREDIASWVKSPPQDLSYEQAQNMFTKVDESHELYYCERCGYSFDGSSDLFSVDSSGFKLLMGRDPVGKVRSHIESKGEQWFLQTVTLTIGDDTSESSFVLNNAFDMLGMMDGDTPIFKKALVVLPDIHKTFMTSEELRSDSESFEVQIALPNGQILNAFLSRNMALGTTTVRLLDGADHSFIFESRDPELSP